MISQFGVSTGFAAWAVSPVRRLVQRVQEYRVNRNEALIPLWILYATVLVWFFFWVWTILVGLEKGYSFFDVALGGILTTFLFAAGTFVALVILNAVLWGVGFRVFEPILTSIVVLVASLVEWVIDQFDRWIIPALIFVGRMIIGVILLIVAAIVWVFRYIADAIAAFLVILRSAFWSLVNGASDLWRRAWPAIRANRDLVIGLIVLWGILLTLIYLIWRS